jgi:hypothetical protein
METDKEKVAAAEAKLNEDLTKATSSEEIRDIIAAQPRDEHGKFTAKTAPVVITTPAADPAKKEDEPTVYKDTFLIGGREVEFTGDDPTDILKQVKAAQSAYEMAKQPEPKKDEVKPGPSKEELAALQLKAASGDADAMSEYMVKSGALDRYLESKGIKPAEIQQVLQERASDKVARDWDGAVKDFLADSKWPGGTQNEKLLKYKLAELKDDKGQPLAYTPSKASLMKAFEALEAEHMLFPAEEKPADDTKGTQPVTPATTTTTTEPPKRPRTGSTAFGTSQEQSTRRTAANAPKVPQITDDMTPQQIMAAFKDAAIANGESPDDVLRTTYAGRA